MHKTPDLRLVQFFWFIFLLSLASNRVSGNLHWDRICGAFFSEIHMFGNRFVLRDGDQSVNTKRDYRDLKNGWGNTGSIRVEENCILSACTDTYFEGNCQSYHPGDHTGTQFQSASCTCTGNCKCEDVVILKNPETCGRAYVNKTCNECSSPYIQLRYGQHWWDFHPEYTESVTSIAIRSGCNLTTLTQHLREGESSIITGTVIQGFQGRIGSYECKCDDSAYNPPGSNRGTSVFRPLNLPSSINELLELTSSNATLPNHPGINAAKASFQSGRSNRNAYILLIGSTDPANVGLFRGCSGFLDQISECRVALNVLELGILNVQLRTIWVPFYTKYGSDSQWVATLDKYLSTHEDLMDSIPNAVIVYHYPMHDLTIARQESEFQRKLAAVNMLKGRILDENYSYLVLAVYDTRSTRKPETEVMNFEAAIKDKWSFSKPTVICPIYSAYYSDPKTDGYWKLASGEKYFHNLYNALLVMSDKSGDNLGHAIFKASFPVTDTEWKIVRKRRMDLLPTNETSVLFHEQLVKDPTKLNNFTVKSALPRIQKLSVGLEKIHRESQLGEQKNENYDWIKDRVKWISVSSLTLNSRKLMPNLGFVNERGNRLYVCRGFVNDVIRVGSFNFEDGSCQIFYRKPISLTSNAEVLMISEGTTKNIKTDNNGSHYRLQYEILSSYEIPINVSTDQIIPVFAGNSNLKNANKFIAFATFAEEGKCGMESVDKIGTASLHPTTQGRALFAGLGKSLHSTVFKVFTFTKRRIQPHSNN